MAANGKERWRGITGKFKRGGGWGRLKKPGGGKKKHSVFEGLSPFPTFIPRPNLENCVKMRVRPLMSVSRYSKGKAPSST